ncbi:Potassium voltage-gated channel subfamily V member 1 [Acipenser ruthenus]|uniref:Potassium voltage-gated channel subfamily V member 1 n=1 Tax=Acipenser ruthenus TaxID=7906 RepID=A0A444U4Y1_ACIRT|nr:Potassium voltage-gated channel subfamily V member 1 [Acipenser ruthenus]
MNSTSFYSSPAKYYANSASILSLESSVFCSEQHLDENPLDCFIINVGGSRYVLTQEMLASYPETRLGKLALSAREAVLDLCDDANFVDNEFFFDRNSQTFKYIMNYYKTGRLHVMEELCAISFLQEIEYWGIDELSIDSCCRDKYYRRKEMSETLNVQKDSEPMENEDEDFSGVICEMLRQKLWEVMEKPDSSKAAKTFGLKSLGMTITLCYEEVGMLLLFLSVGISIFSNIEYAVEHNMPDTYFTSVPCAWWWATTSMTTVGYGDIRPDTAVGKIVACLCILSGILLLSLPIAIINDRFSACYFTLKMKEAALRNRETLRKLTKNFPTDAIVNLNLRDIYAQSIMEMLRLKSRERASTRSSRGDDLWW